MSWLMVPCPPVGLCFLEVLGGSPPTTFTRFVSLPIFEIKFLLAGRFCVFCAAGCARAPLSECPQLLRTAPLASFRKRC